MQGCIDRGGPNNDHDREAAVVLQASGECASSAAAVAFVQRLLYCGRRAACKATLARDIPFSGASEDAPPLGYQLSMCVHGRGENQQAATAQIQRRCVCINKRASNQPKVLQHWQLQRSSRRA